MTRQAFASTDVSRRWILKAVPSAAAGLMVLGGAAVQGAAGQNRRLNPFLEFTADGRVIITTPEAEMGQNVFTGLAKILADEIGLNWDTVDIARAPHDRAFYTPSGTQSTGGSRSMRTWYLPLRQLGARIRQAFINSAAKRFGVKAADLSIFNAQIVDRSGVKLIEITELLGDVIDGDIPDKAPLKPDSALTLIGKDVPRKDLMAKVTGQAQYGADIRLPGMLYASIAVIPNAADIGAASWDAAKAVPGYVTSGTFGSSLAVVAETWWAANTALGKLDISALNIKSEDRVSDADIHNTLDKAVSSAGQHLHAKNSGERTIRADYDIPYLSHICMETMTATAHVTDGKVKIWASVQAPSRYAKRAAQLLNIDVANVTLENTFLGGGFGRKSTDLRALELAVLLSKQTKKPVQVMMNREADIVSDQYRPAANFALSAEVAKDGSVKDVRSVTAMQSLLKARLPIFYREGLPEFPEQGIFPYDAENADHRWQEVDLPVAIGFWRSVGGSQYPFAGESFADEVAYLAKQDPLAFRLGRLTKHPRMAAALKTAADMADWDKKRPSGTGLGLGVFEEWGSVAAQVAQVTVKDNALTIDKIWVAVDCGRAVSPETVRLQMQSGVHCGLSATLFGKVTFEDGQALESNFDSYPIMNLARSPEIKVTVIESDLPPGGVGEIGTPATAPAVANAVFAACGKRIRSLPLNQHFDV